MTASQFESIIEQWSQFPATCGKLGLLEFWLRLLEEETAVFFNKYAGLLKFAYYNTWRYTGSYSLMSKYSCFLNCAHFWPCRLFKKHTFHTLTSNLTTNHVQQRTCNNNVIKNFHHCAIWNTSNEELCLIKWLNPFLAEANFKARMLCILNAHN